MVFVSGRLDLSVRSDLWKLGSNVQLGQNRVQYHFELEKVDRSGVVARAKGFSQLKQIFNSYSRLPFVVQVLVWDK